MPKIRQITSLGGYHGINVSTDSTKYTYYIQMGTGPYIFQNTYWQSASSNMYLPAKKNYELGKPITY